MNKTVLSLLVTAAALCTGNAFAQAPALSYATPTVYNANVQISPLTPSNSGGAIPGNTYSLVSTYSGQYGIVSPPNYFNPGGMAFDNAGNLYFTATAYSSVTVSKITPNGVMTKLAGNDYGTYGDGTGSAAGFNTPFALAISNSGDIYVSERNATIRKVTQAGVVTTLVKNGPYNDATGMAIDASGNIFLVDSYYNKIWKCTPAGVVTLFAGSGQAASGDGTGAAASFNGPFGITIDPSGNLYVTERFKVRKVTPAGVVTSYAGTGNLGSANGTVTTASFNGLEGIAITAGGDLYVGDQGNYLIRKISANGVVTTLAGNGQQGDSFHYANGIGTQANFEYLQYLALDPTGNLFVSDADIRKVVTTGYTITPTLPAGLTFDYNTGTIGGLPTTATPATQYTITGTNKFGTSTANVSLSVVDQTPSVTYGVADFNPRPDLQGVTYTSSNPAVATIVNNKVHVVGAGITTIKGSIGSSSQSGNMVVKKAVLTVTANNQSAYYTYDSPPLTVSYSGFVNGDGPSSLTTAPVANTTRVNSTGIGTYPITVSGGAANNYVFNYVPGVFTVLNVNFYIYGIPDVDPRPDLKGVTYTTSDPTVATVVNNKIHTTGIGPVIITGSLAGHSQSVPITIQPSTMTTTAPDLKKRFGAANPPLNLVYTGLVNGDTPARIYSSQTVTTTATASSAPGAYPITYTFTYVSGKIPYFADHYDGVLNIMPLAPVIKYTTPTTFIQGDTVKAFSPTNIGGAVSGTYLQTATYSAGNNNQPSSPAGIVADGEGNVFVAQKGTNSINKIDNAGNSTLYAGNYAQPAGYADGMYGKFNSPGALAIDAAGNLYVGDYGNKMVRRVMKDNFVNTLADNTYAAGLAADANGNVFVVDNVAMVIYKITPVNSGFTKTVFAGSGSRGFTNGTGTTASFSNPGSMTIDDAGNLYVLDNDNNAIRKITSAGMVSTYATGVNGTGLTLDAGNNLYVSVANAIKMVTPAGTITTVAGSDTSGNVNAIGTASRFKTITGITADVNGNLYVSDNGNQLIKKIVITGYGVAPALPKGLSINSTTGVITGTSYTVTPATDYVVTAYNSGGSNSYTVRLTVGPVNRLPSISYLTPQIYTNGVAIDPILPTNNGGYANKGFTISPNLPAGLKLDSLTGRISGMPTVVSPATSYTVTAHNTVGNNSTVISITVSPTMLAPNISYGSAKLFTKNAPVTPVYPVNTGGAVPAAYYGNVTTLPGTMANQQAFDGTNFLYYIQAGASITTDASGNIYLASRYFNVVQKITTDGTISTIAGTFNVTGSANGTGSSATFNGLNGIAVDASGNIYVADTKNNQIRKITPSGVVSTFAGSTTAGSANGTGAAASFNLPNGMVIDAAGNLYVTDFGNNLIRKITPDGAVSTLAGSGASGTNNGTGTGASFSYLSGGMTIDQNGNLFVGDSFGIRKITPTGVVTTFSTAATSRGIVIDKAGNIYLTNGHFVTRLNAAGTVVTTIAGNNNDPYDYSTADGLGSAAHFVSTDAITMNAAGNLLVTDLKGANVRQIITTGYTLNTTLPAGLIFAPTTGAISGTPTAVTAAANYSVTGYNAAGNSTTTVSITVQDSTGTTMALKNINMADDNKRSVVIYPNPFAQSVNIKLNNVKADNVKVTITHFNGKPVFTKDYANNGVINIDLSTYEKGIYILSLTQSGQQSAYKIIKD